MGENFSAMFQHSMDFKGIERFCEELINGTKFPEMNQCIIQVIERNPHLKGHWYLRPNDNIKARHWGGSFNSDLVGDDYIEVNGPGGFCFTFNKYICEFSACFRWLDFIEDSPIQLELRNTCKEVADYFTHNFAIYMGDNYCAIDYVYEGRDMQYYKTSLNSRFGESKSSISALITETADSFTTEGYYIDYFSDLRNATSIGEQVNV